MAGTQSGNWECQTSVWPLTFMPFCWAKALIASPLANVNMFWVGSVASHFISFSGVTKSNEAAAVAA